VLQHAAGTWRCRPVRIHQSLKPDPARRIATASAILCQRGTTHEKTLRFLNIVRPLAGP
jgi:hypothetical protein